MSVRTSPSDVVAEYRKDGFLLSTDRGLLDLDLIHRYLTECYWAKGIPREIVARSLQNSLCFGIYELKRQIGFGRVISDFATYAYIGDVFVLDPFRNRGLGKWMMECIMQDARLQGLRRWSLLTRDAHGLCKQFGFTPLEAPGRYMELHNPEVYAQASAE